MKYYSFLFFLFISGILSAQIENDSTEVIVSLLDSSVIKGKAKLSVSQHGESFRKLNVKTSNGKSLIVRPQKTDRIVCKTIPNRTFIPINDKHGWRFVLAIEQGQIILLSEIDKACFISIATPKRVSCMCYPERKNIYLVKNGERSKRIKKSNFKRVVRPYIKEYPEIYRDFKNGRYKLDNIQALVIEYNSYD